MSTIIDYDLRNLPIDVVEYDPNQPRKKITESVAIASLKKSVEKYGIQQPITVTEYEPGSYKIIDGHRRYICAEALGFSEVPCLVYPNLSEGEMEARRYEMQNIRRPWKPLERSDALERIKNKNGFTTYKELAAYLGISDTTAADYLELRQQNLHLLDRISVLPAAYQTEITRLKPHMRKHAGMQVDQIIDDIIARIQNEVITNSKDIRIIKSAFMRIDLYGDVLAAYLRDSEMRAKELEEFILRNGFSRDIQNVVSTIAKKKSKDEELTEKERNALKQLVELAQEVL